MFARLRPLLCVPVFVGCASATPADGPPAPPLELAPVASLSAIAPSSPAADTADAEPPGSGDDVATPATMPVWKVNGSTGGHMVLRCENAFPPEDGSRTCTCEGTELAVCADGTKQLVIDRKQCSFQCNPRTANARQIVLACPGGTKPDGSARGCACEGRTPLDPCRDGIASSKVEGNRCVITCRTAQ